MDMRLDAVSLSESDTKNINKNNHLQDLLASLSQDGNQTRSIPALDEWSPTLMHDFDIIIQDNGDWYHEGRKMTRQSLVDLFASVLWGEVDADGRRSYFLKTPSDLYRIRVIDAPLLIASVDEVIQDGVKWIVFGTVHGDRIVLDDKPLYFKDFIKDGRIEQRLYIETRFGLVARVTNNVLYHLVELGVLSEEQGLTVLGIESGGRIHRVATGDLV